MKSVIRIPPFWKGDFMPSAKDKIATKMKHIGALTLSALLLLLPTVPASAQYNNNAWQQQQAIQRQQQMQRQQDEMRRQQQQAQMQAQQRQIQQQQQAQRQQQMQAQQQRQMQQQQTLQRQQQTQSQQRLQQQNATQQQQAMQRNQSNKQRGAPNPSAPTTAIRGASNRNVNAREQRGFVSSGGIAKLTRPLTAGEIKKGFTGKVTGDGRAIVKFQGRVFAVPASTISGLVRKPSPQTVATSRFTPVQRQAVTNRISAIVSGKPRPLAAGAGGSGGGSPPMRYKAAANDNRNIASQMASRALAEGRGIPTKRSPIPVTPTVVEARIRAAVMARNNVAYNVSPSSWDKFDKIGKQRTYLTDKKAIDTILSRARVEDGQYVLSRQDAANVEREFGLEFGSLNDGIKIREVHNINSLGMAEAEDGNRYYQGSGKHLPAGHPEITVDPISKEDDNVSIYREIIVK